MHHETHTEETQIAHNKSSVENDTVNKYNERKKILKETRIKVEKQRPNVFYQCSMCNFKTGNRDEISEHMVSIHNKGQRPFC